MNKYEGIYKVQIKLTDNSKKNYDDMSNYQSAGGNEPNYAFSRQGNMPAEYGYYLKNIEDFNAQENNSLSCDKEDTLSLKEPLYRVREYEWGEGNDVVVYTRKNNKKERGGLYRILARIAISALLFLALFGMSKSEMPQLVSVFEKVKAAITYDYDKKEGKQLGEVRVVSLIKEEQEKKNEE